MIRKSDIQWWVHEARKDPSAAPEIIEKLAERLVELDEQNEQLRNQVLRLERGATPAGAASPELDVLQRKVDNLQNILQGQSSTETALVLLSDQLKAARFPLSQVRLRLRDNKPALTRVAVLELRRLALARPQEDLLLLTNSGRILRLYLHDIPFMVDESSWPEESPLPLRPGERVTAAAAIDAAPRFWTVVTRRGLVRQFLHAQLDRLVETGETILPGAKQNDEPICIVNGDRGDLLILTRWGQAVRFPQHTIIGSGVQGLQVERDDEVVAGLPLAGDAEILALSAAGYILRRDSAAFKRQSKPGGPGRPLVQANDALALLPFAPRGKLLFLTYSGKFIAASPDQIPAQTRLGRGTQVEILGRDPAVAVVFVPGSLL